MKLCTVEECKNKHAARGYCNKHYERFRHHGTVDLKNAPQKQKIPQERHEELFAELSMGTSSLEELGQKYGVTRERIRQLEARWELVGKARHSRFMQKNREKQVNHEKFGDAFNAVWCEAEAHGLKVKGWLSINGLVSRKALFINGRRCWISHITEITYTAPLPSTAYFRTHTAIPGTRIIVVDHPITHERMFYIFLMNIRKTFYINAEVPKPGYAFTNDYQFNKNAWHLLALQQEEKVA